MAESPSPLPSLAPSCASPRSLLAREVFRKRKPGSDVQPGSARHRLASSDTALSQCMSRKKSCSPRVTPGLSAGSAPRPSSALMALPHVPPAQPCVGTHPREDPTPAAKGDQSWGNCKQINICLPNLLSKKRKSEASWLSAGRELQAVLQAGRGCQWPVGLWAATLTGSPLLVEPDPTKTGKT